MPNTDDLNDSASDAIAHDMVRDCGEFSNASPDVATALGKLLQLLNKALQLDGVALGGQRRAAAGDKGSNV